MGMVRAIRTSEMFSELELFFVYHWYMFHWCIFHEIRQLGQPADHARSDSTSIAGRSEMHSVWADYPIWTMARPSYM